MEERTVFINKIYYIEKETSPEDMLSHVVTDIVTDNPHIYDGNVNIENRLKLLEVCCRWIQKQYRFDVQREMEATKGVKLKI